MKYSIAQYAHDIYRLGAIEAEFEELRKYPSTQAWARLRLAELIRERDVINGRMWLYENQPNNKGVKPVQAP